MIRHFCKIIWNRRRSNALILVELTVSFIVLCGALTMASYYALNWNKPLGFSYENLWRLDIDMKERSGQSDEEHAATVERQKQIRIMLDNCPEVTAFTPLSPNFPYTNSMSMIRIEVEGTECVVYNSTVTPAGLNALEYELLAGRWFEPGDETLAYDPVIITQDAGRVLYGDADPIGRGITIGQVYSTENKDNNENGRIVGVIANVRMRSALRPAYKSVFFPETPAAPQIASTFAVKTEPGTKATLEEKLAREIGMIAPDWTIKFVPVAKIRDAELRTNLIPLMILSIVAGFLIVMVGLGLVGVLWQSVTRRTDEIGLRRALGATADSVRKQIFGELMVLTTVAVIIGAIIFLQMPILQAIPWIPWPAYLLSLAVSLAIIFPFVAACGMYPSWLATRIHPAEALQCE